MTIYQHTSVHQTRQARLGEVGTVSRVKKRGGCGLVELAGRGGGAHAMALIYINMHITYYMKHTYITHLQETS